MKFYLFKFHHFFDGLIGYETLKDLKVQLDLNNYKLKTPFSEIPLSHYEAKNKLLFFARIESKSIEQLNIPVSISNGQISLENTNIYNCFIPACITVSKNNYAPVEIHNNTDDIQEICLYSPIKVNSLDLNNFELYNFSINSPYSDGHTDISSLIRTDHMNREEQSKLLKLCYSYSDIFHKPNIPLTFTNTIKHQIKMKDEIPIYTKSYRYPLIHPHPLEYYHLYSIPNVNQTIIIPPSNYLILGKHEYQYDTEECMKTSTKYFYQRGHLLPLPQSEDCVTSILSTTKNTQTCNQISINMKNNIIEEVDQMHYIAVFPKEEKITTICEEKQVMALKGTHPVLISGIQTLTNINVIPIKKLNIEKVPLDKMHLIQLEEENPMENFYIHSYAVNWTLWSIFFILIIFATSYFIFRKRKLQPKPVPHPRMISETQVSPP
ncbi:uncharacterized protein LOC115876156 [Sitophilus oryzae]|uniref:Uncharacterized protein LOC115876156 n=1 Tax=Sitophilus oryzae TaxID=7048 RepID=A0A6J2X938_SITOR|nr:uncharacterized protein LOC115876156 [Sitophilus oryzae]